MEKEPNFYPESMRATLDLMGLRRRLGTEPHVDIDDETGRRLGFVRPGDEHRGPVRVTRAAFESRFGPDLEE